MNPPPSASQEAQRQRRQRQQQRQQQRQIQRQQQNTLQQINSNLSGIKLPGKITYNGKRYEISNTQIDDLNELIGQINDFETIEQLKSIDLSPYLKKLYSILKTNEPKKNLDHIKSGIKIDIEYIKYLVRFHHHISHQQIRLGLNINNIKKNITQLIIHLRSTGTGNEIRIFPLDKLDTYIFNGIDYGFLEKNSYTTMIHRDLLYRTAFAEILSNFIFHAMNDPLGAFKIKDPFLLVKDFINKICNQITNPNIMLNIDSSLVDNQSFINDIAKIIYKNLNPSKNNIDRRRNTDSIIKDVIEEIKKLNINPKCNISLSKKKCLPSISGKKGKYGRCHKISPTSSIRLPKQCGCRTGFGGHSECAAECCGLPVSEQHARARGVVP